MDTTYWGGRGSLIGGGGEWKYVLIYEIWFLIQQACARSSLSYWGSKQVKQGSAFRVYHWGAVWSWGAGDARKHKHQGLGGAGQHRGTGKPPRFGQQSASVGLLPRGDGEGPWKGPWILWSCSPHTHVWGNVLWLCPSAFDLTPFSPSHSFKSNLPSLGVGAGGSSPMADANFYLQEGKDPSLQDSKIVSSLLLHLISRQITVCLDNCQITQFQRHPAEPQVGPLLTTIPPGILRGRGTTQQGGLQKHTVKTMITGHWGILKGLGCPITVSRAQISPPIGFKPLKARNQSPIYLLPPACRSGHRV